LVFALLVAVGVPAEEPRTLEVAVEDGERWWVGVVSQSHRMPLDRSSAPFEIDLLGNTAVSADRGSDPESTHCLLTTSRFKT
jgi:hypothetical protein